jgi:hypothetical protein
MKRSIASVLLALALCLMGAGAAHAERFVLVNGVRLAGAHLEQLDRWHCGPVPDGSYWIDLNSGLWGYPGNPMPQGHVADNCSRFSGGGDSGGEGSSWNGNYGYGGEDGSGFGYVCTDSGCVTYGE